MTGARHGTDTVVLVGGGAGAHAAIAAYRRHGGQARVVLVSAEDRLPYFRPALSKELLRGEQDEADLPLDEPTWYHDRSVEVVLGEAVTGLDLSARHVTFADREPIEWTACVLATGSRAVRPPIPGADDPGVLTLRAAADAGAILEVAGRRASVVVVGSGFLGCEIASGLSARGCHVTMVGPEAAPNQERLGPEVAAILQSWLEDDEVTVRLGTEVRSIGRAGGGGWRVELASGGTADAVVNADAVVLATGAAPIVELAEGAGLTMASGGVAVGGDLRTEAPGVLAVGDIAAAWHPVAARRLRVEHWGEAVAMGETVGQVLAGRPAVWAGVPGFWSSIGHRTLKQRAWGDGWDDVHVDRGDGGFTAWYSAAGRLVGVVAHQSDERYERAADLVTQQVRIAHVLAAARR